MSIACEQAKKNKQKAFDRMNFLSDTYAEYFFKLACFPGVQDENKRAKEVVSKLVRALQQNLKKKQTLSFKDAISEFFCDRYDYTNRQICEAFIISTLAENEEYSSEEDWIEGLDDRIAKRYYEISKQLYELTVSGRLTKEKLLEIIHKSLAK